MFSYLFLYNNEIILVALFQYLHPAQYVCHMETMEEFKFYFYRKY